MRAVVVGLLGWTAVRTGLGTLAALFATRLLGPADRGLMVLGVLLAGVAALLVGAGSGSVLRARLPLASPAEQRRLTTAFSWWTLCTAAGAGGLAVLLAVASAPLVDPGLGRPAFLGAVLLSTAGQVVLTQLPDAWYAAGAFGRGSGWAAATVACGLLGLLLAAALGERTAGGLLTGQAAGLLLAGHVQVDRLRRRYLFGLRGATVASVLVLPRSGVRALGLTAGLMLALRVDRWVVGAELDTSSVAVYSLAATLSGVAGLGAAAVGQVVQREVAGGRDPAWVTRAAVAAAAATLAVGVPIGLLGRLAVVPVFGPAFAPARDLLVVLLLAAVTYAPFEVFSRTLLARGALATAGLLGVLGALAAVAVYAVGVSVWQLPGAAAAAVLLGLGLSLAGAVAVRRTGQPRVATSLSTRSQSATKRSIP